MSDIAIRVDNLSKQYRIGAQQAAYRTIRETLVDGFQAPFRRTGRLLRGQAHGAADLQEAIWALRDVSFEINRGEAVGIIGRNGAGKSTLLKILSKITKPTRGRVEIHGRVGSLLEVGTGFHAELTGRENVYLNGTILGMRKREVDRKFDEIVAFAEIEKFLDTPVKHYSSGMYVRLAFAVAAHLEPEILLVDEVLAVGDVAFQKKCLGKMSGVAKAGRTVLFVSHNMEAVQRFCGRSLLVESGRVIRQGPSVEVVQEYLRTGAPKGENRFTDRTVRSGTGSAQCIRVRILDEDENVSGSIPMGRGLSMELEFQCNRPISALSVGARLRNSVGQGIVGWNTRETYGQLPSAKRGGLVRLRVDRLDLLPGQYYLSVGIGDGHETLDLIEDALGLEITPRPIYATGRTPSSVRAVMFAPCSWEHLYD